MVYRDIPFRAYFDRTEDGIAGLFSIRKRDGVYLLEKALVRSGQSGHTRKPSFTTGKSPIPFNREVKTGELFLWTAPINPGLDAGDTGIGESYAISDSLNYKDWIYGKGTGQSRSLIRLHGENKYPGSAGCIVVVKKQTWKKTIDVIEAIRKSGYKFIPLEVV